MALIAEWGFNEGTGTTAADSSGNSRTATVTAWATGHTGTGADGDTTHAACEYSGSLIAASGAVTVMAWVNAHITGDYLTLSATNSTSGSAVGVYASDATHIQLWSQNTVSNFVTATPVAITSGWHHLAITRSGLVTTLFLDGVSKASVTNTGTMGALAFLTAGGQVNDSSYDTAIIDDLRVDNTALTAANITTYMNTPVVAMPHGAASGTYAYIGSASAHKSSHGAASGTVSFTGSAAGHASMHGAAAGSLSYVGSASGHAPEIEQPHGSASGSYTYEGAAAGSMDPHGSASGTVAYEGTASGELDPHGSASGSIIYTGAASGSVSLHGSASGDAAYVGAASGHAPRLDDPHGHGSGSVAYTGTASGHAPTIGMPHGDAVGAFAYVGTAAGHTDLHGAAVGAYAYVGSAHGTSTTGRDITLTATSLPDRWATTPAGARYTTTPLPDRWRVECLEP
ncbi:LamG domain-containing protein [Humibacter sp. RRB41]|uniref:LamG domain-containing protein n=1 Tax=Humibacter sp. RRB41 TaxID=2919946 RepID=UPI001FA978B2|nr:LamG domain-containing protein [Humibacter sp. RRB41]